MARILVVDDEKCMRFVVGEFLRQGGHEVLVAEDAESALEHIALGGVDVVVSDIVLPRITGIELTRRLRDAAPGVRVVLMSGDLSEAGKEEAIQAGAARCLSKPMTEAELLEAVVCTP